MKKVLLVVVLTVLILPSFQSTVLAEPIPVTSAVAGQDSLREKLFWFESEVNKINYADRTLSFIQDTVNNLVWGRKFEDLTPAELDFFFELLQAYSTYFFYRESLVKAYNASAADYQSLLAEEGLPLSFPSSFVATSPTVPGK